MPTDGAPPPILRAKHPDAPSQFTADGEQLRVVAGPDLTVRETERVQT